MHPIKYQNKYFIASLISLLDLYLQCMYTVYLPSSIIIQYLQQVFAVQVPLLDAVVSRATKENVPLDHQWLDAIIMGRFKVVCGADAPQRAFSHIKQLQQPEHAMLKAMLQIECFVIGKSNI